MRKITYDKIRFKLKMVTGDKESQYIVVKALIHPADITVINIYAPNTGAPKFIKQLLTDLKAIMDNSNSTGLQYPTFSNG